MIEQIADNSFFDFHAKGLDYVCLKRTDNLTIKSYFFDEGTKHGDVVNPHNHRYDFTTTVLSGMLSDYRYRTGHETSVYQCFDWMSPLNGGHGFTWASERRLWSHQTWNGFPGDTLFTPASAIHTISARAGTVLLLRQFEDVVAPGVPTQTFVFGAGREPPAIDGLYRRPTIAEVVRRLRQLRALLPPLLAEMWIGEADK